MQKYLLVTQQLFIDPHGTPDEGGIEKSIVSGKEYDKQYSEQILPKNKNKSFVNGEWLSEKDDEFRSSEDGYNSEYNVETLKPISDSKAEEYNNIINLYNKIK